jgi:hypothetical protein
MLISVDHIIIYIQYNSILLLSITLLLVLE